LQDRVLILHGWGGSDYPHWQSWLASKLAMEYGTLSFPLLNNPQFPAKNRWLKQIKTHLEDFSANIVIAHSLGAFLWLWLASEIDISLKKVILVAPPSQDTQIDTIKSFFPYPNPHLNAKEAMIIASDNDPYISPKEAKTLGKQVGARVEILPNIGHINVESGFGAWEYIYRLSKQKVRELDDS